MISKFFIERPILANVLAVVTIIVGLVSYYHLPVEQYPSDHAADHPGKHQVSGRECRRSSPTR